MLVALADLGDALAGEAQGEVLWEGKLSGPIQVKVINAYLDGHGKAMIIEEAKGARLDLDLAYDLIEKT